MRGGAKVVERKNYPEGISEERKAAGGRKESQKENDSKRNGDKAEKEGGQKTKIIETPIFVPIT